MQAGKTQALQRDQRRCLGLHTDLVGKVGFGWFWEDMNFDHPLTNIIL